MRAYAKIIATIIVVMMAGCVSTTTQVDLGWYYHTTLYRQMMDETQKERGATNDVAP